MKALYLAIALLLPIPTLTKSIPLGRFPEQVSILQLIATPEKFDGKYISVVGFLRVEFEGNVLYLHQDDYEHHIYKNGVWVAFEPKAKESAENLNMHYVFVIGTFDAADEGHLSMASGSVKHISDLMIWPPKTGSAE